jgi:hypothetical protein
MFSGRNLDSHQLLAEASMALPSFPTPVIDGLGIHPKDP